jgi:uncharacterized RDD family membrane protein YckC
MIQAMKKVGDGTRILNFIIDGTLVFLLAFAGFQYWAFYVVNWNFKPINFWWFVAAAIFLYYFLWEAIIGRTPGKLLSASKVVNAKGEKPAFGWILIRSLVRIIPIDFFFNAILGMPLHDYLSKTMVVEID